MNTLTSIKAALSFVLLTFSILFTATKLQSQEPPSLDPPRLLPLSPEAGALHSAISYPMQGNTGSPDISITLFTLDYGGISVPVTLRYSTANCKVDGSVNPNVAYGWVHDVGGNINRVIKGKPDETARMYPMDLSTPNNISFDQIGSTSDQLTLSRLYGYGSSSSHRDTEYDEFYFTMPTSNGNFIMDRRDTSDVNSDFNALFSPSANYKLWSTTWANYYNVKALTSFLIRDGDGFEYRFGGSIDSSMVELGKFADVSMSIPTSTGWALTRIRSDSGNEVLFSYEQDGNYSGPAFEDQWYQLVDNMWPHYAFDIDGAGDCLDSFYPDAQNAALTANTHLYRSLRIKKISFAEGYVKFYKDSASTLLGFTLFNNNNDSVKRFIFNKGTNNLSSTMRVLNSVEVKDASGGTTLTYSFSYNNTYSGTPGNTISFDYWGYFNGATATAQSYLPNRGFVCYGSEGLYGGTQPQTTFNIGNGGNRTPHTTYIQHNILNKITYPSGGSSHFVFEPNKYIRSRDIEYPSESIGPGLRIKEIVNRDKDGSSILTKSVFSYYGGTIPIVPNLDGSNTITTYVANVGIMRDYWDITGYICPNRVRRVTPKYTPYVSIAGEAVSYDKVEESIFDSGVHSGKRVNYFVNPDNYLLSYMFSNSSQIPFRFALNMQHIAREALSYNNSYLDKSEIFDKYGTLVSRKTYHYAQSLMQEKINMGFFHLVSYNYPDDTGDPQLLEDYRKMNLMTLRSGGGNLNLIPPLVYYFYVSDRGVRYPSGIKTEIFHSTGTFTKENTIDYTLFSPYHYPRTVSEQTSVGDLLKTDYIYPFDSLTVTRYRSMVNRHFLPSRVISQTRYRQQGSVITAVDRYVTMYDSLQVASQRYVFRPGRVYYSTQGAAPEKRVEYLSYNARGNPLHIRTDNTNDISYIWSYGNNRPVAMV